MPLLTIFPAFTFVLFLFTLPRVPSGPGLSLTTVSILNSKFSDRSSEPGIWRGSSS